MDLITQIQTYMQSILNFYAHSIDHIHSHAIPFPADQHPQTFDKDPSGEKADQIFKRVAEGMHGSSCSFLVFPCLWAVIRDSYLVLMWNGSAVELLIASLPERLSSEQDQLAAIQQLEQQNQDEAKALAVTQAEGLVWEQRCSMLLRQVALQQLNGGKGGTELFTSIDPTRLQDLLSNGNRSNTNKAAIDKRATTI